MKLRLLPWLLAASTTIACDGGILEITSTSALMQTSSPEDDNSSDADGSEALLITGAVLIGISVVGTVVAFTASDDDSFSYLERHQQEVRVALAKGDGAFVTDIAQSLKLPHALVSHLGEVLHAARPELEPSLAETRIDRERARAFSKAMVSAIASDPVLAPYVDRALILATTAAR